MATNHPSVPDADPAVGQVDPALFTDDAGNFDPEAVKRISNRKVPAETCADIRRHLRGKQSARDIADEYDFGPTAIRKHATGKCACPVSLPPLKGNGGVPWQVDTDAADCDCPECGHDRYVRGVEDAGELRCDNCGVTFRAE